MANSRHKKGAAAGGAAESSLIIGEYWSSVDIHISNVRNAAVDLDVQQHRRLDIGIAGMPGMPGIGTPCLLRKLTQDVEYKLNLSLTRRLLLLEFIP